MPEHLLSEQSLDDLVELLREYASIARRARGKGFGPRVRDLKEAQDLYEHVMQAARQMTGIQAGDLSDPQLILTHRLSRMPRKIVKLYLLLAPICILGLGTATGPAGEDPAFWILAGTISFLLAVPLLLYRRARLNIEHGCEYRRDGSGRAAIVIDELPAIQFQSYLAHEIAHHLFFQRAGQEGEPWIREGWTRLVQWRLVRYWSIIEKEPAYLYHAGSQIVGELKFACELIAGALGRTVPLRVRRIRTMYLQSPILQLLTGTPAFDPVRMIHHALGTAAYLSGERHPGACRPLDEQPEGEVRSCLREEAPQGDRHSGPRREFRAGTLSIPGGTARGP